MNLYKKTLSVNAYSVASSPEGGAFSAFPSDASKLALRESWRVSA
jgi:hypothetical protein